MTQFWREGHYRNGSWVDGHWVIRNDWGHSNFQSTVHQRSFSVEQTQFSSFTIPNATCPLCGDSVFYYENKYGSKVWFDCLGPPWPIHGCFEQDHNSSIGVKSQQNIEPETHKYKESIVSVSYAPCVIKKSIKRTNRSYVIAKIYDEYKKHKDVFFILEASGLSSENYICFIQERNDNYYEIFYYDIARMQHGSIKGIVVENRETLLFLARYKQKNLHNLEQIAELKRNVRNLKLHLKIAVADWLYSNTLFDSYHLSVFSGLDNFTISKLVNDKLKITHVPQSPVTLGLIDDHSFSFLLNHYKYIQKVI